MTLQKRFTSQSATEYSLLKVNISFAHFYVELTYCEALGFTFLIKVGPVQPRDILCPLKLALTSPKSGGRSVGIVHWRTEVPEFFKFRAMSRI
jgi:hypothetical protein